MNKIRKGDEVVVLTGREKGRRGFVSRVVLDAADKPARVLVEGLQMVTHYVRPNPQQNEPGGLIKKEAFIHASNVALFSKEKGRAARVGFRVDKKSGKKQRVLSTGEVLS